MKRMVRESLFTVFFIHSNIFITVYNTTKWLKMNRVFQILVPTEFVN